MNRRHTHRLATQHLTPGDDQPETPCTRDVAARLEVKAATGDYPPSPIDRLMDRPADRVAAYRAAMLCLTCPASCLADRSDKNWTPAAKAILHALATNPPRVGSDCGTERGYQAHRYNKEPRCELCKAAHARHNRERKGAAA